MRRGDPAEALKAFPQWCLYNDARLIDIALAADNVKGNHFKATRDLRNDEDNVELPLLLSVPKDMVLSAEAIQQYAKVDKNFRDIYDVAGHQSHRVDTLLFLLLQYIYSWPDFEGHKGGASPWTWYFDVLPSRVPLPTMWTEEQFSYLRGTSLETAVPAKISALIKEFDHIKAHCEKNSFWHDFLHEEEVITVKDWVYLDALYRSRSLELPRSGESMVPVLDMVNHSPSANAYFDETTDGEVRLLVREGHSIKALTPDETPGNTGGDEVTIDYGQGKSAAEMLFSYGFIDRDAPARSLILPLDSMDDDPLARAKAHVFEGAPTLKLEDAEDKIPSWSAPLVYLMCLNEDDGIDFRVLQTVDGSRQLRLFWQEEDVTDKAHDFEGLIVGHDLEPIFHLRAITVIHSQVEGQIERLRTPLDVSAAGEDDDPRYQFSSESVLQLRHAELDLMVRTLAALEHQRDALLQNDRVRMYLGSMEEGSNEEVPSHSANSNEDFS